MDGLIIVIKAACYCLGGEQRRKHKKEKVWKKEAKDAATEGAGGQRADKAWVEVSKREAIAEVENIVELIK